MFNTEKTVISQYAASPIARALIGSMGSWIDAEANVDLFYNYIWNIYTAQGYGLDVWGRILGFSRILPVTIPQTYFGFNEGNANHDYDAFHAASFFSTNPVTQNFVLPDNQFRLCLMAKAATNISEGSITAINAELLALFPGRGVCYVADGPGRTLTYTFQFHLSLIEQAIVLAPGLLPRPAGVAASLSSL